ncbi:MAG TPA: hypothetical protein DEG92_01080 [Rikenellaceae bacterium]|nr:hypothetical protein [Rikenellaceae bacterium]
MKPMKNEIKTCRCPVCKGKQPIYAELLEVDLYFCKNCRHRFTDPHSISSKEEYSQEYYDKKHRRWFENPDVRLFEFIYQQIERLKPDASVLDVGCGNGAFLKYLRRRSTRLKLTGIDLSFNVQQEGIKFYQSDIFALKEDSAFDVVVNLAVIEHIWELDAFIAKITRLCKSGGIITTMTVNDDGITYFAGRMALSLGKPFIADRLYEKHHVNHFSDKSLRNLFKNDCYSLLTSYLHSPALAAIDTPGQNNFVRFLYLCGLTGVMALEKIAKKGMLQTLVVKKNDFLILI